MTPAAGATTLTLVCLALAALPAPRAGEPPDPPTTSPPPAPSPPPAIADTLRSPYGPAGRDEHGRVEIWRLPALAREDTFGVRLRYELREIEIRGELMSLREILRRAQLGERRRRRAIEDLTYREHVRASLLGGRWGGSDKHRIFETRSRIYYKSPDRELRIQLADREYGDQEESERLRLHGEVSVEIDDILDLSEAPFYLDDIDAYRYEIKDRRVFPDRVVYGVAFRPRNDFDVEPSGTFWIDAGEFVVVHEEMRFERNPAPLMLKSIDGIVRERRRIDGHWMVTRFQARAEVRGALILGFQRVEIEAVFSDFQFNTGLDDAIFGSR